MWLQWSNFRHVQWHRICENCSLENSMFLWPKCFIVSTLWNSVPFREQSWYTKMWRPLCRYLYFNKIFRFEDIVRKNHRVLACIIFNTYKEWVCFVIIHSDFLVLRLNRYFTRKSPTKNAKILNRFYNISYQAQFYKSAANRGVPIEFQSSNRLGLELQLQLITI